MQPNIDPLAALRDIALPAAPPWWPPAVGWWLVLAMALLAVGGGVVWVYRWIRRGRARRAAIASLQRLDVHVDAARTPACLQQMSRVIRRLAIAEFGRRRVAGLSGEGWLHFLEHSGRCQGAFVSGVGRHLISGPYQPQPEVDLPGLQNLLIQWCRQTRNRAARRPSQPTA